MSFIFRSIAVKHKSAYCLLSLLHVPPSREKMYIPLSLVHLIYTTGDNCMHHNACSETPCHHHVLEKNYTHQCCKIYQVHSRPKSANWKGFSDQSDQRRLINFHKFF